MMEEVTAFRGPNEANLTDQQFAATFPNICSFPTEVITKILSHLSTQDLLGNVALVSKQFYILTKTPGVHLVITISQYADEKDASTFLLGANRIRELHITGPPKVPYSRGPKVCDRKLLAVTGHSYLRVLNVYKFAEVSAACFIELSKSRWWSKLVVFHMNFSTRHAYQRLETHEEFETAVQGLGSSCSLKYLGLGCEVALHFSKPVLDLYIGPTLKNLKSLTIYDKCSQTADTHVLAKIIDARKDTLEELSIQNELNDFVMESDIKGLVKCSNLKSLRISTVFSRFETLTKLENLTTLFLDSVDPNLCFFLEFLTPESMPKMRNISIKAKSSSQYGTRWNDMFMSSQSRSNSAGLPLTALASACPNLTSYKIETEEYPGTRIIQEVMSSCTKLEVFCFTVSAELEAFQNRIDAVVPDVSSKLKSLRLLHLDCGVMTDASEKSLLQDCANLLALLCNKIFVKQLNLRSDVSLRQLEDSFDYRPEFSTLKIF